jgi:lipoate-protein ligase A
MAKFQLIVDAPHSGAQNMAVDEALLLDAAENGTASLRFYEWSEPTLSLGYFQRYGDRSSHTASRNCAVVRRQTGGGAILHDRELTYSITIPSSHPIARRTEHLYTAVHEAFISELSPLLAAKKSAWHLSRNDERSVSPASAEPFLCFQRRALGDVVLIPPDGDRAIVETTQSIKILGSAQRRYHGAILQHGSLLLEKSPYAPELAGWSDITGVDVRITDLIQRLTVRLIETMGAPNSCRASRNSSTELQSKVEPIANNKYGSAAWTKRR